ncbi:ACP S-malonyltransferase [Ligilactobacillus sp. WILCCON 0076]|uniref:Malonyl CoA-acyl carrier protein transacylase n=1 Tax=Ligilactobacillus ubinensis TaxID=2876789 RepID=A0A9X2JLF6_9LACO|nr:ACP S-malonyltransferase [Ligilactobacillus ubinensis]MCP0886006.1 ACP S-malonyltransferase [Ligilactobacillus ubinensis]
MEKFGILFSGQGAQYTDMGLDFYHSDALFKEYIDQASELTKLNIVKILQNKENQLDKTANVQPALVAVSIGIYAMLKRDYPDFNVVGMLGLSLGEYAALIASKAVSYTDGMQILRDRGVYMQKDADTYPSMLAAVLNPDINKVEAICSQISTSTEPVGIANYNSPKQVVIGGSPKSVSKTVDELQNVGAAKKVVPLKVSGAFHTPLFKDTSTKLEQRLAKVAFGNPCVTVMSNTTAHPFKKEEIANVLTRQVCVPTHFGDCAKYLIDNTGVNAVLEIGPGKTLSKFVKQVDKSILRYHIEDLATYNAFGEILRGN